MFFSLVREITNEHKAEINKSKVYRLILKYYKAKEYLLAVQSRIRDIIVVIFKNIKNLFKYKYYNEKNILRIGFIRTNNIRQQYNIFYQVRAAESNNIPLNLYNGQSLRLILPNGLPPGLICSILILQGNNFNTADGILKVKISNNNKISDGERSVSQSIDNSYFEISLKKPIKITSGIVVVDILYSDSTKPEAIWLWPVLDDYPQIIQVDNKLLPNRAIKVNFTYNDRFIKIIDRLLPINSRRRKIIKFLIKDSFVLLRKSISHIREYGIKSFITKVKRKFLEPKDMYYSWIDKYEPKNKDLELQKKEKFAINPIISIIVPVWNTPRFLLEEMIKSVLSQTYQNWELCIADASDNEYSFKIINYYAIRDKRIKVIKLCSNRGIALNTNDAIELSTGSYITFLDHDDTLSQFALYEVASAINKNPDADFLYSDEDKISEDGKKRYDPHFKQDFAPDTLRSHNYICHLSVLRKELLKNSGYFKEGFEGSQDYDLILRCTENAKRILHIPKILYHWRSSQNSTAMNPNAKLYAYESAKKALREHINRLNLQYVVKDGPFLGVYKIQDKNRSNPKISIIIPNKDHKTDLESCINSIIQRTTYKNYEIIIVENNSVENSIFHYYKNLDNTDFVKIISWAKPFNFSAINNYAVKHSSGEVLLFLNNDTEVISQNWIEEMLILVQRKDVGVVGAKLLYKDNSIQHAGVILGLGGIAGHAFKNFDSNSSGYFGRLSVLQNLSAVTGACMMIRKEVFDEVDGFDEEYAVAFNDVDLCMKVRDKNYLVVWTPYAELYHSESRSRGYEDTPEKQSRFIMEVNLFQKKWKQVLKAGDPYYNPNLTLDRGDFSLK